MPNTQPTRRLSPFHGKEFTEFEVLVTPCAITREFDRCVRICLGYIDLPDGERLIVQGAFSREALRVLGEALEMVPDPIGLPKPDEIKERALYQWGVITKDGEHYQQYEADGERNYGTIINQEVQEFWVFPRFAPDALPWYGIIQGEGFFTKNGPEGELKSLDLPYPTGQWPWIDYFRDVTVHFGACAGAVDVAPPHVVQVLGWKIDEHLVQIGVEEDGSWQVWRKELPEDKV